MGNIWSCFEPDTRCIINKDLRQNRHHRVISNRNSYRSERNHLSKRNVHNEYPYHQRSSVRSSHADITETDDYVPRKQRRMSQSIRSRSHKRGHQRSPQLNGEINQVDLTRQGIEEQLLRNLEIARHNAEISSRPPFAYQRRVRFDSITKRH